MTNWIKDARKQTKLTQVQFCERYQIPRSTLVEWEANKYAPPIYVKNLLLRCVASDFNITLEEPEHAKKYLLTYANGGPLSTEDEMYVNTEKNAKRVSLIKADSNTVKTYKCSNGFTFKAELLR